MLPMCMFSVSDLQVVSVGFSSILSTSLVVSWTPPQTTAEFINYYKVSWQANNDNRTNLELPDNLTSTTTPITGLTPGVSYRVFVKSVDTDTEHAHVRFTSVDKIN